MPIVQQGAINTAALIVPDIYVQIVPPQNLVLNGVPTDVVGMVGTASWGPVNTPIICSSPADYARAFGPVMQRKYDLGTAVAAAVQQGAANFRCVRVTDATDTGAVCSFNYVSIDGTPTQSASIYALYSGTFGNSIVVSLSAGSAAGTWRLTIAPPGVLPEVFDNIADPNPAGFWINLCAAVNYGLSPARPPSLWCGASGGGGGNSTGTVAIGSTFASGSNATGSGSLTGMVGGTDGVASITAAVLVGTDTDPAKGMYALRGQGCGIGVLADADDSAEWSVQAAFGLSEGVYMVGTTPAGDTIATAVSAKAGAGIDCYAFKLMFGDWVWWNDPFNGTLRLISPQGFVAGRLANLSPEQSSLNKSLYGVVGTQKSGAVRTAQAQKYSAADLSVLFSAGIDVIANPGAGGLNIWTVRDGCNTSSNAAIDGDEYTRLTNYIADTLAAGMGQYVGLVINPTLLQRIRATQLSFLRNMLSQGLLGYTYDASGNQQLPFGVICDASNNPQSRTSLGYVQSDAQVTYQGINKKFIVNIEGGSTVTVNPQTLPSGQV